MTRLYRVGLDHPLVRGVRSWRDGDESHRAVMRLFSRDLPGGEAERRAASGILYRREVGERPFLLVQAGVEPIDDSIRSVDLEPLLDRLSTGRPVRFRTEVNAVRSTKVGRVYVPEDEIPSWLLGTKLGLALTDVAVEDVAVEVREAKGKPLSVARIDGLARVENPEALAVVVRSGLGRARAFGCGLVSLAT